MKIKENCEACTSEPFYDLFDGGYLDPEEILEDPEDAEKVLEAIATIQEFLQSCEDQIEGFYY